MRLLTSFFSHINPFARPDDIKHDLALMEKIAKEDIASSDATIRRAEYIKHMAIARLNAAAQWRALEQAKAAEPQKGDSNVRN